MSIEAEAVEREDTVARIAALDREAGEEVEDDRQHSDRNIPRVEFRKAYVRENHAPPKRRGSARSPAR